MLRLFLLILLTSALYAGDPGLPQGGHCAILDRQDLIICHSPEWLIPQWVAYRITRETLEGPGDRKREKFYPDPALPKGKRAELVDYRRSGFDRGHMAPASSMKRSQAAMHKTFSLANMAPQRPELNREMWRKLEDCVRELAKLHGSVWVVTGPYVDPESAIQTIGPHRVRVPAGFFKAVFCDHGQEAEDEMFAFLMGNARHALTGTPNDYTLTVRGLEFLTELDLFPALPRDEQNHLETAPSLLPEEALKWRPPAR